MGVFLLIPGFTFDTMYYFYDGTKDMGFHGYRTEKAAIREAIIYAKRFPRRYIGVYEEHNYGGDFLGRVYIGTLKGKKTVKYETHSGTYRLNKDGSFGEYLSSNRYVCAKR